MNTDQQTSPATLSDEQLWRLSVEGDRDAFGRIVERYQTLICSLALSASGNVANSEDLAQDTFVTAWRRLRELREPQKLRQWLCGIVRNLSANRVRRDVRRGGPPAPIETIENKVASDENPAVHAVSREEELLLWNALHMMPETYREPMVLYYREHQSIAQVAASLDLSEEAVKQRLSRGRTMLRDEMAALVESTLVRTRPGAAFAPGVLAALPMATESTAGATLAAKAIAGAGSEAVAKGILAKLGIGAAVGPLIGVLCAYLGTKAAASTARSEPERACIIRYSRWIVAFCFAMSVGLVAVLTQAGKLYPASVLGLVVGVSAWTATLVGGILLFCQRMDREIREIRIRTHTTDEAYEAMQGGRTLRQPKRFESKLRVLGLPLFAMTWGGYDSDRYNARAVFAWIAIGDIAVSPLLAFGGLAVAPVALGAISFGVLSLNVFWGVAVGLFAVGSLSFGWWSIGCVAAGMRCAIGFAAIARDYALGIVAAASETGPAARAWIKAEAAEEFGQMVMQQGHWFVLLCAAGVLAIRWWQGSEVAREDS